MVLEEVSLKGEEVSGQADQREDPVTYIRPLLPEEKENSRGRVGEDKTRRCDA